MSEARGRRPPTPAFGLVDDGTDELHHGEMGSEVEDDTKGQEGCSWGWAAGFQPTTQCIPGAQGRAHPPDTMSVDSEVPVHVTGLNFLSAHRQCHSLHGSSVARQIAQEHLSQGQSTAEQRRRLNEGPSRSPPGGPTEAPDRFPGEFSGFTSLCQSPRDEDPTRPRMTNVGGGLRGRPLWNPTDENLGSMLGDQTLPHFPPPGSRENTPRGPADGVITTPRGSPIGGDKDGQCCGSRTASEKPGAGSGHSSNRNCTGAFGDCLEDPGNVEDDHAIGPPFETDKQRRARTSGLPGLRSDVRLVDERLSGAAGSGGFRRTRTSV